MSSEIRTAAENAADATDAADVTDAADAASAARGPEQPPLQHCENCGALVASRYCGDCGQPVTHPLYSVWHFLGEATEDLTHADSRLWRTLSALLFRPGYLTREFLDGRRARYLPPVRLYLVLSVLFFLTNGINLGTQPTYTAPASTPVQRPMSEPPGAQRCEQMQYDGPWSSRLEPALKAGCYKVAQDHGQAFRAQMVHTLPRALFVLLPLLALFMKLMYWRPPHYYIEHLLFFIHNTSAVFLLMTLSRLTQSLIPSAGVHKLIDFAVTGYLLIYLYRSMRRVYGQRKLITAVKFISLSLVYLVGVAFMFAAVVLYSYLTL